MPRGGKRAGSGRKTAGDRVAVLVRIDKQIAQRIEALRNGRSMSSTVQQLLRTALNNPTSDDEMANRALGYIVGQAAMSAGWKDRTWRNDAATLGALKLAIPLIVDFLGAGDGQEEDAAPHPFFKSADEHARSIFYWVLNRLKERGDEYGIDWPSDHPLRNFPKAAAALNFEIPKSGGAEK